MDDQLLSVDDIANKFNVSKPTIYRWLKSNRLPGRKVGGQWRFDAASVQKVFLDGGLSVETIKKQTADTFPQKILSPVWARPILNEWGLMAKEFIDKTCPHHVVVNDRRGAKIWELISDDNYRYAKNLWHSTAISFMPLSELYETFANKRVLLFDEMMQHGREMHILRQRLAILNSSIESLVCIRRKSHIESGELIEYKSTAFENLDDDEFAKKAAFISKLMDYFEPPLDVGHLVIRGKLSEICDHTIILNKLAKWGIPFVIRYPDNEHPYLTVTLDRPQFFDTSSLPVSDNIRFVWDGPCKIRFYLNLKDLNCSITFIAFPGIVGPLDEITGLEKQFYSLNKNNDVFAQLIDNENSNTRFARIYCKLCMDLSFSLLKDFIESGAPQEIGISLNKAIHPEDLMHLEAIFGSSKAKGFEAKINNILSSFSDTFPLFQKVASLPPPLLIRTSPQAKDGVRSQDSFMCRVDLLKTIPQKFTSKGSIDTEVVLLSYGQLIDNLDNYSESTIGKIIDYDLDWGVIKPSNKVQIFYDDGIENVKIERCFSRGEFGAWFEFNKNPIAFNDAAIQRTLALGPVALKLFLKWYKHVAVTQTIFHKIFSNLQHDWDLQADVLYLGWLPYKFGPIPIWPSRSGMGHYPDYKSTLLDQNCIEEVAASSKKGQYKLIRPNLKLFPIWERLYKKEIFVTSRVNISSLTRLYARIQETIFTNRRITPYSDERAKRNDALIVLSAARNEKIAYICAHWEMDEWIRVGKNKVFPQLRTLAAFDEIPKGYYLKPALAEFSEPVRLLFDKLEMYLSIDQVFKGILRLKEDENIEIAEALLEKTDPQPILRDDGDYPVKSLLWFSQVMFSYTYLLRQIMNNFDLDIDQRFDVEKKSDKGTIYDSNFYLAELMSAMPELLTFEKPLMKCIKLSNEKKYDETITQTLSNTFFLIVKTIEAQNRFPDPMDETYQKSKTENYEGTIRILREMPISQTPYAIAVADIKNLVNLPKIASDLFGVDYDEAVLGLLNYVQQKTFEAVKNYTGVRIGGFRNDNIFICGTNPDEIYNFVKELIAKTTRQIREAEQALEDYGLLRIGIAWKEDTRGDGFKGIMPGFIALKIGDKSGQKPGSISITQEIFERLSNENQSEFIASDDITSQGKVFVNNTTFKS